MRALPHELRLLSGPTSWGLAIALTLACSPPARVSGIDQRTTSVLLLTLCTVRADHLGAYGYALDTSPNLDRLAREGVLFEHALTSAPWTRPGVAASITGLYPRSLGIEEPERSDNDRGLHPSFETLAESMQAAGYFTIGLTANPNVNAVFRFDQGYDLYRDTGRTDWKGYHPERLTAETLSAELLGQLRERAAGRRFFAHLVWVDAHQPLLTQAAANAAKDPDARWRAVEQAYDQKIHYMDRVFGELLPALRAQSGDDLLVVVTADHGEAFARHHPNDVLHGHQLYDSTLWVPLVVQHPALGSASRRIAVPVETVDIPPTLLDLLGIAYEEARFEGFSLAETIASGSAPVRRRRQVAETAYQASRKSAIFEDDLKLVVDHRARPARRFELYDRNADPNERVNLAPSNPERVALLLEHLETWQRAHPPRAPDAPSVDVSPDVKEQLRSLGYGR